MDDKKRKIIAGGIALMILITIFPPWIETVDWKGAKRQLSAGYHFIANPPSPKGPGLSISIDVGRLFLQYLGAIFLVVLLLVWMGTKKEQMPKDRKDVSGRDGPTTPSGTEKPRWVPHARSARIDQK